MKTYAVVSTSLFILVFFSSCKMQYTYLNDNKVSFERGDVDLEEIYLGENRYQIESGFFDDLSNCLDSLNDVKKFLLDPDNNELTDEGINGRNIIYRDLSMLRAVEAKPGVVSLIVCIDPDGYVVLAGDLSDSGRLGKNKNRIKSSMFQYRYEEESLAPCLECGKYTLRVDINK